MNKPFCTLAACLLLLSIGTGCGSQGVSRFITTPQPTATSQPTATPIPGWVKFEGDGVEIWLPEGWQAADPRGPEMAAMIEAAKSLGPEFEQAAQAVEQDPSGLRLWIVDPQIGESGLVTNVTIGPEHTTMDLTEYLDALSAQFASIVGTVVERESIQLDRYQAQRLIVELPDPSGRPAGKEAFYAVEGNDTIWIINFFTGIEEFDQRLPIFELSMRTFTIRP